MTMVLSPAKLDAIPVDFLADPDGMVLYMNDQEAADPAVVCDGGCAEEWPPLVSESGSPTAEDGVTGLSVSVSARPDGTSQITYNGRRLYTFAEDHSAGEASGNGDADEFDGQQFTWHAATLGGAASATTPAVTQPSGATSSGGY